jgi:hypothetical protein
MDKVIEFIAIKNKHRLIAKRGIVTGS